MALPGRDDATAAAHQQWQRGIDRLDAICAPRPRRGHDLSMEIEPPLDEVESIWGTRSSHAHKSMKVDELGYDAWGTWVPGGAG